MSLVFLEGGGGMGALMRGFDWGTTPVGEPTHWPQSLKTAVSLLLESRFPMLLCWGPDFTQFYNDPFRPILGATKHPAIGRSTRETFAEAWHIIGPLFARVMAGDAVGFEDMLVPLDRNGFLEDCYFTYSYSPIRAEGGEVAGVFVICSETTSRVVSELANARALEAEKRRAEALAELDRAKTTFFSNVSHEFRTPLTLMLGPLEEALGAGDPLRGDDLAIVHRNVLRLLKLVNALLEFSRIEAGRTRAAFEPTDLCQLTTDIASTFRSAITSAGLEYHIDCGIASAPVQVDRDAWEKIVLNLLSNALKFTFDGAITVLLRERADQIELSVQDTGVGIPEHEIPHLFDRFHRVEGTRARTHEGSGIGLALVGELVKLHGGTVVVTSMPGKGSTFRVSLPARRAPAGQTPSDSERHVSVDAAARPYVEEALRWLPAAAGPPPRLTADIVPTRSSLPSPTILVADDNADMRQYVARLLSDRWTVEEVSDGAAALARARAFPPALIISDVMMPGLDGFALVRALRADARTREVPIILLSARAGEDASVEGLEAGADDYIVKPFSARELRARVEAQLLRTEIRAMQAARDRQLTEMFRHAPVAIAILRGAGHAIDYVNDEYMAVVGRRDLVGKGFLDALPELADQQIGSILDQVYTSGRPFTAEAQLVTLNRGPYGAPERAYFNFVYQPMRNRGEEVDGIAVIAVEVTELARARHDAEAADRAKDQFLAVLGHELRNPLAPILTAVRLLELKGPKDPVLQRLRETISRQATQMLKLVEDLLDVGRIITGKLRLEKRVVDIAAVARQAAEASLPFIEKHGHTLQVMGADNPLYVEADGARITQVLCNLLNNAAKFMPDGGRVELAIAETAGTVSLSVRDHGAGIPHHMLERVFDRFVQAEELGGHRGDGLGIGLSLVKTMVELHGGTVVARSDGPGRGSEFTVSIPMTTPSPAAAP